MCMDSRVDEIGTSIGLAQRRIVKTRHGCTYLRSGRARGVAVGRCIAARRKRPLTRLEVLHGATVSDTDSVNLPRDNGFGN